MISFNPHIVNTNQLRGKTTNTYIHHGHHLFIVMCIFHHCVGNHRVKAVRQSYLQSGLSKYSHGNAKRTSHNTLSFTQITYLVKLYRTTLRSTTYFCQAAFKCDHFWNCIPFYKLSVPLHFSFRHLLCNF